MEKGHQYLLNVCKHCSCSPVPWVPSTSLPSKTKPSSLHRASHLLRQCFATLALKFILFLLPASPRPPGHSISPLSSISSRLVRSPFPVSLSHFHCISGTSVLMLVYDHRIIFPGESHIFLSCHELLIAQKHSVSVLVLKAALGVRWVRSPAHATKNQLCGLRGGPVPTEHVAEVQCSVRVHGPL